MARLGFEGKLYYKVGGVAGGGSWVEVTQPTDVTVGTEAEEVDFSNRSGGGFAQFEPGLISFDLSLNIVWDPTNANFTAFRQAFYNRSVLGIRALDADVSTGEGPEFDAKVFSFERSEPIRGGMFAAVTLKPCVSATPPTYKTA